MADYIQAKMDDLKESGKDPDIKEADENDIVSWHNWFANNREKYFLEDFYVVDKSEPGNVRIKGIPLFKGQDLNNPLPKDKGKIEECLRNLIIITLNRACKMACVMNCNSK